MKTENIKVKGHVGTWYIIDSTYYQGLRFHLLEHEKYGDMAPCLIVNDNSELIMENVLNGFEDLRERGI